MSEIAAVSDTALYDHEQHHSGGARDVADWGADEAFAAVPRRRPSAPARRPSAPARRTVLVTGRPDAAAWTPRAAQSMTRRRPPRTVNDRFAARPDRVAAWAFGLGITLILVAVTTANAATL